MAAAGVRIYLYNNGYYHAKSINMDSEVFTVGSGNMDIRSYNLNYEVNAVVYNEKLARELEADFMRDIEDSTEFDLAEYRRRPVYERFIDSLCRLTSPLL
jgi:cardiolipin synthase